MGGVRPSTLVGAAHDRAPTARGRSTPSHQRSVPKMMPPRGSRSCAGPPTGRPCRRCHQRRRPSQTGAAAGGAAPRSRPGNMARRRWPARSGPRRSTRWLRPRHPRSAAHARHASAGDTGPERQPRALGGAGGGRGILAKGRLSTSPRAERLPVGSCAAAFSAYPVEQLLHRGQSPTGHSVRWRRRPSTTRRAHPGAGHRPSPPGVSPPGTIHQVGQSVFAVACRSPPRRGRRGVIVLARDVRRAARGITPPRLDQQRRDPRS